MIHLTFYKGCQLTNKYESVFAREINKTGTARILDDYLNTLQKVTLNYVNYSYFENNGLLVLDKEQLENPLEYNYFKVSFDNSNMTNPDERFYGIRYCFINKVELKNGCILISYEEDIWSSYSQEITGIDVTTLTNSRLKSYNLNNVSIPFKKLPVEYEGDNNLSLDYNFTSYYNCFVILEVQLNQMASATEVGWRETNYCVLGNLNSTDLKYQLKTALTYLNAFIQCSTWCKLTSRRTNSTIGNYEIGDIYIVPAIFDLNDKIEFGDSLYLKTQQSPIDISQNMQREVYPFKPDYYGMLINILEGTIYSDYKNISFGTFSHQFKIVNNGNDIPYKVYLSFDKSNIAIKLAFQNNLYDITEDYRCNVPVLPVSSDGFAQRKIALELQNANLRASAFSEGAKIGLGGVGIFRGMGNQILDYPQTSLSNLYATGISNYGILSGVANMVKNIKTEKLINSPIYSSSKAVFGNDKCFLNFATTFVTCKIQPSNEIYVKNCTDNLGYIVNSMMQGVDALKIISDYSQEMFDDEINYNYIKFDDITIYGKFSREIAIKLEQILTNGVKIWYDANRTLDNYNNELLY